MTRIKERNYQVKMESRCASYLYHLIHDHPFRRMPISPNRSASLNGTSNGSPKLICLNHHHRRWRRRHLLSVATCRLQDGMPSECAEVVEVYSAWTVTPLNRSLPRDEPVQYPRRSTSNASTEEKHVTDREISWRIRDRWLFDADDEPSFGHDGPDEKDEELVDEFHPKCVYPKCVLPYSDRMMSLIASLRHLLKGILSTRKTTMNGLRLTPRFTHCCLTSILPHSENHSPSIVLLLALASPLQTSFSSRARVTFFLTTCVTSRVFLGPSSRYKLIYS
jgi:hypothetical protein